MQQMLLAWAARLIVVVVWLVGCCSWLAPRLPSRARLAIILSLVGVSLLALAVTDQLSHDYRPFDLVELSRASEVLFTEFVLAVAGGTAALLAIARTRANHAAFSTVGAYLAGVGLVLYWLLGGESSIQAPLLLLLGGAIGVSAAGRLAGSPPGLAIGVGLASSLLLVLEAEGLRGSRLGSGGGPSNRPDHLAVLVGIEVVILLVAGALLAHRHGRTLAGPFRRTGLGLAGTGLVVVLRGPGEWLPHTHARSTSLYGVPLTLFVLAVSLVIADWPAGARRPWGRPSAVGPLPRVVAALPLVVPPLLLTGLVALWHPAPASCAVVPYAQASPLTPAGPTWAGAPAPSSPRGEPDLGEFARRCVYHSAKLDQIAYAVLPTCKWPPVDPDYPLVQASGVLRAIDLSPGDSPWLHTSHDLEMDVAVDPASEWLVLGDGGPDSMLHVEAESGPFPEGYRPVAGDRVTVAGRWVFDCGHDAKTELHPAAVLASEHDEWRTELGVGPQRVRAVRVWMNSAPGLVHVPLAPLDLQVTLPPDGVAPVTTPVVQVVAGSPSGVHWSIDSTDTQVAMRFVPPTAAGSAYFEVLLGSRTAPPVPTPLISCVVTFDRLAVRDDLRHEAQNTARDMMGGIPLDLINPQLGLPGTGHWFMQAIVDHTGRNLMIDAAVESGHSYALAVPPVHILAPVDQDLHLAVTGYAENDPSDGVTLASGQVDGERLVDWDAGPLGDLCDGAEHTLTPPNSAWTLSYHVTRASP